jgi:hypothetical protein
MTAIWLLLLMVGPIEFETVRTMAPLPEEDDLFLANVLYIEEGEDGRIYASDFPSAKIHYWQADGTYLGHFGQKGEGPGEFVFGAALGPPMGYIYALDQKLFIYDGSSRTINIFTKDHEFIKRVQFDKLGGKINNVHVLGSDRFMLYDSYFCNDKACRRILQYNDKGNLIDTWATSDDNTWKMNDSNGKVKLFIWEPTFATDFSRERGELVIAHTKDPILDVYNVEGKKLRSVTLEIPKKIVTAEDKAEFMQQRWVQGNNTIEIIFPEEKNYFEYVLTLPQGYLVYHKSAIEGIIDGFLVDFNGKVLGRFKRAIGQSGGLFASRGKLFGALIDDEGDFSLQELKLNMP